MPSAFETINRRLRNSGLADQQRNRRWWETLPMTYEAWENESRGAAADADLLDTRRRFLEANPWLSEDFDFSRYRGRKVLEIGCGAGGASCHMAQLGAVVTAIDLTRQATHLTRRHAYLAQLPVQVAQMDAEKLALPDGAFDDVFSWGVLHHSTHTDNALQEVARVLRPQGSALIMVYNRASLRYWLKGLIWLLLRGRIFAGDTMQTVQRHFTDGFYHRHFTAAELTRICSSYGLAPQRMAVTHMSKKMLPLIPRKLDDALKRRYGWLLVIEASKA
ncbi:MAG: methyltransferase domain-containing protein [Rhodospirillales bacterium]